MVGRELVGRVGQRVRGTDREGERWREGDRGKRLRG